MADPLVVRVGPDRWLNRSQVGVVLAALAGLLTARTDPVFSAGAAALLAGCAVLDVHWSRTRAVRGRLHLARDGDALLFTRRGPVQAWLAPGVWVSRALCVLELREMDTGRRRRCLICRSRNEPATYRGLLRLLRHLPAGVATGGADRP